MLSTIASYFTGRAAKAGIAAIVGALGAPGAVAGAESVAGADLQMTILGYVVVGALQGLINWAAVYFKANKEAGLY
ncbi:hypothetical protein [Chelativorans sp. YIM 93263]|uniref:hypothetical protein n=1 Tax=Chelativorans sp. YIM 93263 TaxID=2906648 RepID=UPI0023788321|nr:hypothetical protein [Chelativorans sp. YIM 93263]